MNQSRQNLGQSLDGEALAYLGDAVIELFIRERLLRSGISKVGELNNEARCCVRAAGQSDAFRNIEDELSEEELAVFKRGRNASRLSAPKSASMAQYRCATGFEALIGYLHLSGERERLLHLLEAAYQCKSGEENKS